MKKDRKKRGRPITTGIQGQAISIYVTRETLAMIRERADAEEKSASAVVSDAVRNLEAKIGKPTSQSSAALQSLAQISLEIDERRKKGVL